LRRGWCCSTPNTPESGNAIILIIFCLSILSLFTSCKEYNLDIPQQLQCEALQQPLIYMPWREAYTSNSNEHNKEGCVFCNINNGKDIKNFVLARYNHNMIMLNLYPYSRGHILIVPYEHVARLTDLTINAQNELIWLIGKSVEILETVGKADGVNVGINFGTAAHASIPDHLHIQLVPRFKTEMKGFVQLIGQTRMVSWDLNKLFEEFRPAFQKLLEI